MRKFVLTVSIAAASIMITACGDRSKAPKDSDSTVNVGDAMSPDAGAKTTDGNAADAKMGATTQPSNVIDDDDKGGDPTDKK